MKLLQIRPSVSLIFCNSCSSWRHVIRSARDYCSSVHGWAAVLPCSSTVQKVHSIAWSRFGCVLYIIIASCFLELLIVLLVFLRLLQLVQYWNYLKFVGLGPSAQGAIRSCWPLATELTSKVAMRWLQVEEAVVVDCSPRYHAVPQSSEGSWPGRCCAPCVAQHLDTSHESMWFLPCKSNQWLQLHIVFILSRKSTHTSEVTFQGLTKMCVWIQFA